jgi:hypothetical protein
MLNSQHRFLFLRNQFIAAQPTMGAAFGIERLALAALIIHFVREPIGKDRADD